MAGVTGHRWNFFRAGGVDQARIATGADILAIESLDQRLWVALSCPVRGLEFDERTLALLDADKDGRVRAPEVIAAIRWLKGVLRNPDELVKGADGLPLASIDASTDEGKRVLGSAKQILAGLGKPDAASITVDDTMRTTEVFKQAPFNGDGVVPPESIGDAAVRQAALDAIACAGGVPDRSGLAGVNQAKLDEFFAALEAYDGWWKRAEADRSVLPLGDDSAAAFAALQAIRPKVDDYFARSRVAEYDPRSLAAVSQEETAYLSIAAKDMSITAQEVAGLPLARVEPGKPLPFGGALNPAWAGAAAALRERVLVPILGKDKPSLSETDWRNVIGKFASHEGWVAAKAGAAVEKLGLPRVREILAGDVKAKLAKLIADDLAVEAEMAAIESVERLARYYRDLHRLLLNFVSFADFYGRERKAVFQAGTLYIDGRTCELCVRVDDAGKHAALAGFSKTYLAYLDCARPATGEKLTIAAAVTAGDADFLMVGRNALFYDRKGRDWDATVTRIVENPIGIRQAFWMPYKRVLRFIEEQVAKRAAAADAAAGDKLAGAATKAGEAAAGQPPAAKPRFDVGTVAALGVAVGGITAALGALLQAFFGLGLWMPLGLLAIVLLISGPAMGIAWLKLRQRNLGPILDANGWAVNGRVVINIPLGGSLTSVGALPAGAVRSIAPDPFAQKRSAWPRVILVLAILGIAALILHRTGHLGRWIDAIRGRPAAEAPAPPASAPAPAK